MKEDQMRSIVIWGEDKSSLLDALSKIERWKIVSLGTTSGHNYWFTNGEVKIAIRFSAENVIVTVNVLPHDNTGDQEASNKALKDLSDVLNMCGIDNSITASDNDLV